MQKPDCVLILPMRADQPRELYHKLARLLQFMDLLPDTMTRLCEVVADQLPPEDDMHATLHHLPEAVRIAAADLRMINALIGGGLLSWKNKPSGTDNEGNA